DPRAAVAVEVPGDPRARREVVAVLREVVFEDGAGHAGHTEVAPGPELPLVPHPRAERQAFARAPLVLEEDGQLLVDVADGRLAVTLRVAGGQAEGERFQRRDGLRPGAQAAR